MPTSQVLDRYYRKYYEAHGDRENVAFHRPIRFGRHLIKWIRFPPIFDQAQPLRICDIGGGDGSLGVAVAQCLGYPCELDVVDFPSKRLKSTADLKIAYLEDLRVAAGAYHLVLASAVIEHMTQLSAIMPAIFDLIGPGGYFYARTPYVLPFMKVFRGLDFTFPGHLHDLGPEFWNGVLRIYGRSGEIVVSQPSIVETDLRFDVPRTLLSMALKCPAMLECRLSTRPRTPLWPFVGGWEIILRMAGDRCARR